MRLQKENVFLTEDDPGKIRELKLGGYVEVSETEGMPTKEDLKEELEEQNRETDGTKAELAEKLEEGREPGEGLPNEEATIEAAQAETKEVNADAKANAKKAAKK